MISHDVPRELIELLAMPFLRCDGPFYQIDFSEIGEDRETARLDADGASIGLIETAEKKSLGASGPTPSRAGRIHPFQAGVHCCTARQVVLGDA